MGISTRAYVFRQTEHFCLGNSTGMVSPVAGTDVRRTTSFICISMTPTFTRRLSGLMRGHSLIYIIRMKLYQSQRNRNVGGDDIVGRGIVWYVDVERI